jgi:hemerythrin-like metal-binding protein
MDSKYVLGIQEIDTQHEDISALVETLQGVIARRDQRHLIAPTLRRLNQLLVTHFEYEESLMQMVSYFGLPQHRKMHQGVLRLFNDYFAQPSPSADYESLGKLLGEKVLGHVMEHDIAMTEMVRDYLATFRSGGPGSAP